MLEDNFNGGLTKECTVPYFRWFPDTILGDILFSLSFCYTSSPFCQEYLLFLLAPVSLYIATLWRLKLNFLSMHRMLTIKSCRIGQFPAAFSSVGLISNQTEYVASLCDCLSMFISALSRTQSSWDGNKIYKKKVIIQSVWLRAGLKWSCCCSFCRMKSTIHLLQGGRENEWEVGGNWPAGSHDRGSIIQLKTHTHNNSQAKALI